MKVSILISTYGEESWIEMAQKRALPSAEAQGPYEVLFLHEENATIASVRNENAKRASGDWLCYLDADDELDHGFLDAMEEAWKQEDDGSLLFTPAVRQIKRGRSKRAFFFPECSFKTGNWLVIGTIVPTSLHRQIGGFRDHPHGLEDYHYWARCIKAGARIVKVPNAIYVYHWNEDSKHHLLRSDNEAYMKAYEEVRKDLWG